MGWLLHLPSQTNFGKPEMKELPQDNGKNAGGHTLVYNGSIVCDLN